MPAKKSTKSTKSRVSNKAKKHTDKKLFIALGVLVIAIVAVVGILWYRSSQAAVWPTNSYYDTVVEGGGFDWARQRTCLRLQSSGRWCYYNRDGNIRGAILWGRVSDSRCATIWNNSNAVNSKFNIGAENTYFPPGTRVVVAEYYYGTKACNVGL